MSQVVITDPPGFSELNKMEQVEYLQQLWDRIAESPESLPIPESSLQIAEQRLVQHRRDRSRARSAFEVIDRLSAKAK